jgi:hypothetical protein
MTIDEKDYRLVPQGCMPSRVLHSQGKAIIKRKCMRKNRCCEDIAAIKELCLPPTFNCRFRNSPVTMFLNLQLLMILGYAFTCK